MLAAAQFWGKHIQVVSLATAPTILLALFSRDVVLKPTMWFVPLPLNMSYTCAHIGGHTDNVHQTLIILTILLALRVY